MKSLLKYSLKNYSRSNDSSLKSYIKHYRRKAFESANLTNLETPKTKPSSFDPADWAIAEIDSVHDFPLCENTFTTLIKAQPSVLELIQVMEKTYLGTSSVEFSHVPSESERRYLFENYETVINSQLSEKEQVNAYKLLESIHVSF